MRAANDQSLPATEAELLLDNILAEIDAAIFVFDENLALQLVNRAGAELLGEDEEALLGRTSVELGLARMLLAEPGAVVDCAFNGGAGRWDVRRSGFSSAGQAREILVLTSVESALRAEEQQAWRRLIRVLGHELGNSLTPIQAIAASLRARLAERGGDDPELDTGLEVIERRSRGLNRFVTDYAKLARLPDPKTRDVDVGAWLERNLALESRLRIEARPGPRVSVNADPDQLDQAVINLLRNAVDAALATGGGVRAGWTTTARHVEIFVEDDGPGIAEPENLFVPFYTTKENGSGIGLVLARQIVEQHGGQVEVGNRTDARGCRAVIRLPSG